MDTNSNRFRERVLGEDPLIWAFELVPPEAGSPALLEETAGYIHEKLHFAYPSLDALLIPDVDPEERGADGTKKERTPLAAPRAYAEALRMRNSNCPEIVLHRRSVQAPMGAQEAWLQETAALGYTNLIPVGGDTARKPYPGPNPVTFAQRVQELNATGITQYFQGGICIPSRGMVPRNGNHTQPDHTLEPRKLLAKEQAGMRYFTTQILYETGHVARMHAIYRAFCEQEEREPARILLGISPLRSEAHCAFLEWLGVIVPPEVKATIFKGERGVTQRSITYLVGMAERFFDKIGPNHRSGLYVESTHPTNLAASLDLLGALQERFPPTQQSYVPQPTGQPRPEAI